MSLCLLLLLTIEAWAQDVNYARTVIETLASPEYHGRGYVFGGDSLAAEFIENEFKKNGLLPLRDSYSQKFHHHVNTFPGNLAVSLDGNLLKPGAQYLADPASPSGSGTCRTTLLSWHEILENKWQDKIKKSKNKALLVDLRNQNELPADQAKQISDFSAFLKFDQNIPAKAIFFLQHGKTPWHVAPAQAARPAFYLFMDSLQTGNIEKLHFEIEAKYIQNYRSRNVIGFIPGTSGKDSSVVITAHYDHLGRMGKDHFFPGAHDNASGVALMLDLAKQMNDTPPLYNTYFIAFAAEEAGLLGSLYFVHHPLIDLNKIKLLINLDLAGTGDDGITVVNGQVYQKYFEKLKAINDELNLMKAVNARGEACNSDHCFFHQKGVPSFFIYTLGGTTYYHDIYDTAASLSLSEYENYFRLLFRFLQEL